MGLQFPLGSERKSSLSTKLFFVDATAIREVATAAVYAAGITGAEVVDAVGATHRVVFVIGALASGVATRV